MDKCGRCKHYKKETDFKGICIISKTGERTRLRSDAQCLRFEKGTYDGLERNEHNLKIIMDTIARCYQPGRFG